MNAQPNSSRWGLQFLVNEGAIQRIIYLFFLFRSLFFIKLIILTIYGIILMIEDLYEDV